MICSYTMSIDTMLYSLNVFALEEEKKIKGEVTPICYIGGVPL